MTVRHVAMFRWKEGTSGDDVAGIEAGLSALPGLIPLIGEFRFGPDLGINDGNWDFVVVADFAGIEAYVAYRDDPHHRAFIADKIAPQLEQRAGVQYEIN